MQTKIRQMVSSNLDENIILMADGFEASLLFVAQSNLGLNFKSTHCQFLYKVFGC